MTSQISPELVKEEKSLKALEKIRPELNLEKWLIWKPSKSTSQPKRKVLQREITLPDGNKITARVEIGFTDRGELTTEDQKVYYALIKLWEDSGYSTKQTFYSLRQLAKVLRKKWGTNVIESTSNSLFKLRGILSIWENSYYDSETGETIEFIDTFTILSELKIIKRKKDGIVNKEAGYFRFNDFILKNLLANHTKPLFIDVVINFKGEIAQILYTYLDLIMANKTHYERRTKELFSDLNLEGTAYQNLSNRKQKLEKALKELQGIPLSTGILATAKLEPTQDGNDYKVIFKKTTRKQHEEEGLKKTTLSTSIVRRNPEAEELAKYFHLRLNRPNHQLTSKELDQATSLIAEYGYKQSKFIVDYAIKEAEKTKFQMRTFGAVFQYQFEAIKSYEEKKKEQELLKKRQVRTEREQEEKLQKDLQEKEELDNLYNSLTTERKDKLQILIQQKFNKHPFKPTPGSPLYESTLNWAKYETLKTLRHNPDLI